MNIGTHAMIIAISGKSGCGNSSVSKALAAKCGYTLINYTFREYAGEHGLRFEDVHHLASKNNKIDQYIDDKQVKLAQQGNCIVGSRLAIWKIEHAHIRVYLTGSLAIRARRISQRENTAYIQTLFKTWVRDTRDYLRYRKYYRINMNRYTFAELIVDSTHKSVADIVDIIYQQISCARH